MIVDLSPTRGHEQSGLRPALVISDSYYNETVGLALICPITTTERGHYFEVRIDKHKTEGFILAQQLLAIDYVARKAKVVDRLSSAIVKEVIDKVKIILS